LGAALVDPLTGQSHPRPVKGQSYDGPEFYLQGHRELMLDLFKDNLNLIRILDQCLDGGRKQGPETMELLQGSAQLRFVTCQGRCWFDRFRIEREQA
jgi:hypothetical protein